MIIIIIILQQAKNLKYLGCEIYHENEKLLKKETTKIFSNTENFNYTFNPTFAQKFSSVKLYTSLALLIISYRSEIWKGKKSI